MGAWVSVVGMGWVSVVRVGVGLRVRMGWVSVVGMGWVSLSRVGMGWVCGQDGEGLSRRDGVGLINI